jgi:hypothetical protein
MNKLANFGNAVKLNLEETEALCSAEALQLGNLVL